MKFLEVPNFAQLSDYLAGIDVGDSLIYGRIDAFTCNISSFTREREREEYEPEMRSILMS